MNLRFRPVARIVAIAALAALPATMVAVPAHAEEIYGDVTVEFTPETGPTVAVNTGSVEPETLVATVKSTIEGASFELGECRVSDFTSSPTGYTGVSLSDCAGTYADVRLAYDPESGTVDVAAYGDAGAFHYRRPRWVCWFVFSFPPPRFVLRCRWVW